MMKPIRQFQAIGMVENLEFHQLAQGLEDIQNSAFIEESPESGVKRWEEMLGLIPKDTDGFGSTEISDFSPDERTDSLHGGATLRQQLALLCGENGYTVELHNKEYTVVIRFGAYRQKETRRSDGIFTAGEACQYLDQPFFCFTISTKRYLPFLTNNSRPIPRHNYEMR